MRRLRHAAFRIVGGRSPSTPARRTPDPHCSSSVWGASQGASQRSMTPAKRGTPQTSQPLFHPVCCCRARVPQQGLKSPPSLRPCCPVSEPPGLAKQKQRLRIPLQVPSSSSPAPSFGHLPGRGGDEGHSRASLVLMAHCLSPTASTNQRSLSL